MILSIKTREISLGHFPKPCVVRHLLLKLSLYLTLKKIKKEKLGKFPIVRRLSAFKELWVIYQASHIHMLFD